jgi:oligosaccharide repeat unit polymerase
MNALQPYIFIFSGWVFFGVSYHVFDKKVFHPVVLLCLLWATLFTAERLFKLTILTELNDLSLETYLLIFLVLGSFFCGGLVSSYANRIKAEAPANLVTIESLKAQGLKVLSFFLVALLIGLPFYVKSIFSIQEQSANENFLVAVRSEIIYGEMDIGPTKYLVAFSVIAMAIANYLYGIQPNKANRFLFFLAIGIALTYNFLYTGRISIFMIIIVLMGVRSFFVRTNPLRILFNITIIFGLLFSVLGILYEKGGSVDESAELNAQGTSIFTALYLVGPLHGLNYHIDKNERADFSGEHTLAFFLRSASSIGITPTVSTRKNEESYLFMPYPINVYTAFRAYLRDFGVVYTCLMFFFFGLVHGYVFLRADKYKEMRFVLYYAFLLFPLLLTFFDDQYLNQISSWLKIIVYIELFYLIILLMHRSRKFRENQIGGT